MATTALWLSFAGGMNAAPGPYRLLAEDELPLLVNGTVRNGWVRSRPPWIERSLAWNTVTAQRAFERGVFQGAGFYAGPQGPRLVCSFSGEVLIVDPTGRSYTVSAAFDKPSFSGQAEQVFFQKRGKHLIAQDGINPPVILTGDSAAQGTDPTKGVPVGTMMADGWGRLAVVLPGRRRIAFSDHETDPTRDSVLSFTEDTEYFKNARFFEIPGSLGLITGIIFAPILGRNADQGPLLVFCEKGVRAFDVSQPRSTWTTADITSTPLPETGGGAAHSLVARGADVIFTADDGRIMSLKSALRRDEDARLALYDEAVWPLYSNSDGTHLFRRWACRHDNRTLITVAPERVPGRGAEEPTRIRHRGIVALQEQPRVVRDAPVWDGLWTGILPVCLINGTVEGVARCWAVSLDLDGIHRLYELGTTGPDQSSGSPRRIETLLQLRPEDFDFPFRPKPYSAAAFRLDEVSGGVTMRGWWQQDGQVPVVWFTDNETVPEQWVPGADGNLHVPQPLRLSRINPPSPPINRSFYEASIWLAITGNASLSAAVLEVTEKPKASPDARTVTASGNFHCAETNCAPDPFGYNIRNPETIYPC